MSETAYKITTTTDDSTGKKAFILEGNLGIEFIREIRKELLELDWQENSFMIEVKNAYKIDISTVQLIYSWIKTAEEKGLNAELKILMRDDQKALIQDAGFTSFV